MASAILLFAVLLPANIDFSLKNTFLLHIYLNAICFIYHEIILKQSKAASLYRYGPLSIHCWIRASTYRAGRHRLYDHTSPRRSVWVEGGEHVERTQVQCNNGRCCNALCRCSTTPSVCARGGGHPFVLSPCVASKICRHCVHSW